jgi:hypothetical protein
LRPPDASGHVSTELVGGDTGSAVSPLPLPSPELFLEAGFTLVHRAVSVGVGAPVLEGIMRRAVQHADALRHGAATALTPSQPLL